jgi:DEAD/DEAH box helicase domain-containing protein
MASEPVDPERVAYLVGEAGLAVVADHRLEARQACYEPVPAVLHPRLRERLEADWGGRMYAHQANAIASFMRGEDVCLATPTASGKSLAFMAAAVQLALTDPDAMCVAVYPVKALIRDQLQKWRTFLSPFGLEVGFVDGGVRCSPGRATGTPSTPR